MRQYDVKVTVDVTVMADGIDEARKKAIAFATNVRSEEEWLNDLVYLTVRSKVERMAGY